MTEWNAAAYARIAALQEVMAAEAISLLALQGTEHVLDLGCGSGKITAQVAARVSRGSVLGIDASAQMIGFASDLYSAASYPNLRFQTANIRNLPFREEFDLIISFNALHWIPEQDQALRSIRSAMKPGAVAQLRLVPDGERKSLENVLEEVRQSAPWSRYFDGFQDPYLHLTLEQYKALAEKNGFHVDRIITSDMAWDFHSREAFEAFGSVTFVEWSKNIPESERPAFVKDVLDRYRAEVANSPDEANVFKFYQMDVTLSR